MRNFLCMWALIAVSRLAEGACLAVSVSPGLSVIVPRLASRVTVGCQGRCQGCNTYLYYGD